MNAEEDCRESGETSRARDLKERSAQPNAGDELVKYAVRDRIAYITLNQAEEHNRLSTEVLDQLRAAFDHLDRDAEAEIGILSGNGRVFCAGDHVGIGARGELREATTDWSSRGESVEGLFLRQVHWKPVIASVHGSVVGAGLRLALMCELVFVAEGTSFQVSETRSGAPADLSWALLLQRTSGSFATDVAITGRPWTAEEAYRAHAVDAVVPLGEQVKAAEAAARDLILDNPPLAVRAIVEARRGTLEEALLRSRLLRRMVDLVRVDL